MLSKEHALTGQYRKHLWTQVVGERLLRPLGPILTLESLLTSCPRLVNRYTIGADPEFLMLGVTEKIIHASDVVRQSGSRVLNGVVGEDGSGCPIELRPPANKYAINVVAGLLAGMQMLHFLSPTARRASWHTGGLVKGASLGGHIHFSRKTPFRADEVRSLNGMCIFLYLAGVFKGYVERFQSSDRYYGFLGDVRQQGYGYEYRTPPSWLQSPRVAHLVLTLSKLSVFDKEIWTGARDLKTQDVEKCLVRVHNVLEFYRPLDDDAAIALNSLDRTLKDVAVNGCIKEKWGISGEVDDKDILKALPPSHQFDTPQELVRAVQENILKGTPLSPKPREWGALTKKTVKAVRPISSGVEYNGPLLYECSWSVRLLADVILQDAPYLNSDIKEPYNLYISDRFLSVIPNPEYRRLRELMISFRGNVRGIFEHTNTISSFRASIGLQYGLTSGAAWSRFKYALLKSKALPVFESPSFDRIPGLVTTTEDVMKWRKILDKI